MSGGSSRRYPPELRERGDDRVGACRQLADALGATVLLKGNVTVIADPGGPVYLNPAASPGRPPPGPVTCCPG